MLKVKLNLRKVVAIAICLAGVTVFSGCDKNKNGEDGVTVTESWVEFAGEKSYYVSSCVVTGIKTTASPTVPSHYEWSVQITAGKSGSTGSGVAITAGTFYTPANNPNGTYRMTSDPADVVNSHYDGLDFSVCGSMCYLVHTVKLNGATTTTQYNIISGTLEVDSGNVWTIKMHGESKDANGNIKPVAMDYKGSAMFTEYSF